MKVFLEMALSAALLLGCGPSLPPPPMIRHPDSAYVEVPYPPPAALAETVPARPSGVEVAWVDGEWAFRGKAYAWKRGGWVQVPEGARYARSEIVYAADGRVLFAPGTWYNPDGSTHQSPRPTAPATTPPNELTAESQTGR